MNKKNRIGEQMKEVIRNQIQMNNPPETKQTYERLIKEGISKDETMRKLAVVMTTEMHTMLKKGEPFNSERYVAMLKDLPEEPV